MKVFWKMIIIAIVSGIILAVLGISLGANLQGLYWDKTGVHMIENKEIRITETDLQNVGSIDVDAGYSDVVFAEADKFGIDIHGYDGKWDWDLKDGVLSVKRQDMSRISLFNFPGGTERNNIKIYLPKEAKLETVAIKAESGNVAIGGFTANNVQIDQAYGDIDLQSIVSDAMSIALSSGKCTGEDLNVQNITYQNSYGGGYFAAVNAGSFTADSESGDFELTNCIAEDVNIANSYGKITAEGLQSSQTKISADSGNIALSGNFSGETAIKADYGDIKFTTSNKKTDYVYSILTSYGTVTLDGESLGMNTSIKSDGVSGNRLEIAASSGDIEINFGQ